ncbi:MAG TPA: DUF1840 domain-containing protein [Gammaproteobacteria bacterium]
MLVTFKTKAYANITMFGDVAVKLLRMMGHSGTVPSAILADDVPAALERLKRAVAEEKSRAAAEPRDERPDDEQEPPVSLANRALPLIELLEAAVERHADVMWES